MKHLLFILLGMLCYDLSAQDDLLLLLKNNYQRTAINPSMTSDNRLVIALPSLDFNYNNSGLVVNDFVSDQDDQGIRYFDFDQAYDRASEENHFSSSLNLNYGSAYFSIKNIGLSIGGKYNMDMQSSFHKDLVGLIAYGNQPYIGTTLSIGPTINYHSYHELFLGVHFKVGKVKIGVRGKVLNGVESLVTPRHQLNLTTDDDVYSITLDNDYVINSSALFTYDGFDNVDIDFNDISNNNLLTYNFGYGIDLGLRTSIIDNHELGLSINDMGSVTWDRRVVNYTSQGIHQWRGVDLADYIEDDNVDNLSIKDSLNQLMNFEETNHTYKTSLPLNVNLSYIITRSHRLNYGVSINYTRYFDYHPLSISALVGYRPVKWWQVSGSLQLDDRKINLNLMSSMDFGRFHGYVYFGDLLSLGAIEKSRGISFGLGANFNIIKAKTYRPEVDELIELK
jgi:hypothetical protein